MAAVGPGTSAIKVVEKLPGVNFQSADAFGAYEWSTRITIRGFNQNQIGFTLDGVPLGDMSYGNFNGLHISRAPSPRRPRRDRAGPGRGLAGDGLDRQPGRHAGSSQLARDPSDDFGVYASGTAGSDSMYRGFVRLDTGDAADRRPRLSPSYANQNTDKWKGVGEQKQQQINFKAVQPIGEPHPVRLPRLVAPARERLPGPVAGHDRPPGLRLGQHLRQLGPGRCQVAGHRQQPRPHRLGDIRAASRAYPRGVRQPSTTPISTPPACATTPSARSPWTIRSQRRSSGRRCTVYGHNNEGQGLVVHALPSPSPNVQHARAPPTTRRSRSAPPSTTSTATGLIVGATARCWATHAIERRRLVRGQRLRPGPPLLRPEPRRAAARRR